MYYRLEYAIANHLCHHRSDSWILTSLGETVLHLPELEATRMLLALETFFHSDQDQHSFCMPLDFPEKLLNMGSIQIKAPWDYEKNLYDYSERLVKYRLMAKGEGSYNYNYVVTHLGQLVLESIVAKDSIYDTLIPVYIREMIVGSEASRFSSAADFQRLRDVVTRSTIAGDLRQDILDEIFRLQQANSAYPSIFTALAPKVEGLLRNLCKVERIELTDKTDLGAFIGALKKAPVEILKPATLEMLNCIFRPFRNIVEHGYSIPEEPARLMCQLSLNVIEQIHSDHAEYKQRART